MSRLVHMAVEAADIARLDADVIALKYPCGLFGAAGVVAAALGIMDDEMRRRLPSLGSLHLAPGNGRIGARQAAFLSVVALSSFNYEQIRQFTIDWRLPTLEELQLIRQTSLLPVDSCYWSGDEAGSGEAFYMHFDDGHVGRGPRSLSKGLSAVFVRTAGARPGP